MRTLWLDFQKTDPGRQRPGRLLLAAGIMSAALLLAHYREIMEQQEELQHQISRLPRQAATEASLDGVATQEAVTQPLGQWNAVFSTLEAAGDETVTLLGLQPGHKDIQITGEARDLTAAMDYLGRLQTAKVLGRPRLTRSEVLPEHPLHPLRFALAADWPGAAP